MIKRFIVMTILTSCTLASNTIRFTNIIKNALIFNKDLPCLYTDKSFSQNNKQSLSLEHIFPICYLDKKDQKDMHNIVQTYDKLNTMRSNYKYTDVMNIENNWQVLCFDNYVNHKEKLFIPNAYSRGFIARSILYMSNEYNYNHSKIIDKDVLKKWYYQHPPTKNEIYHNEVVKKLQNKNNIFISKYNKKTALLQFLDK